MRTRLTTIVAGAVILLTPAAGLAQSSDDGPIATAPDAPRDNAQPPPDQPDQPPPAPAAYAAPQPEAAPAPPPAESPQAQGAVAPPAQAGGGPPGAVGYAAPPHGVSFLADTASKDAMAGALSLAGAALAINLEMKAGDKLVSSDAIDDPAAAIAHAVAEGYAAAHGGAVADAPAGWDGAGAGSAHYLVKVSTSGWGFTYYPLDWSHYHLSYDAKLELVDVASRRVLAKATCSHKPDTASERFTYDELTGAGGATLKSQLKVIADECVAKFDADVAKG
jgi:hypothetical protein